MQKGHRFDTFKYQNISLCNQSTLDEVKSPNIFVLTETWFQMFLCVAISCTEQTQLGEG